MRFTLYSIGMQPLNLIHNRLLCLHLNVLINSCPDVIAFHRRDYTFDFLCHVLWIDGDFLIAVLSPKLSLILQLQAVKSDKFVVLVR
ncbi:hypothetical protein D3C71_1269970 [compost metagenome]